jgi:hypothetical protein
MNKEAERFAKIATDLGISSDYAIDYYDKKLRKRRRLKETIIESLLKRRRSLGRTPSCDSCGDDRCSD